MPCVPLVTGRCRKKHSTRAVRRRMDTRQSKCLVIANETKVNPESNTETFAAIKFFIDNWRWQNVPFYVRTGKRMHESASVITIQFKDVPHLIFPGEATDNWQQNRLIISIQPEMSIRLQVQAKSPGLDMVLNTVDMVFDYESAYSVILPKLMKHCCWILLLATKPYLCVATR